MLFSIALTLGLTGALFLLCALCRTLLHALQVRRFGCGKVVLVGTPDDVLLPGRVQTAFVQSQRGHLQKGGAVLVVDCGLSDAAKRACCAAVGAGARVRFLAPDEIAQYLLLSK